jgi:hypothetical protein
MRAKRASPAPRKRPGRLGGGELEPMCHPARGMDGAGERSRVLARYDSDHDMMFETGFARVKMLQAKVRHWHSLKSPGPAVTASETPHKPDSEPERRTAATSSSSCVCHGVWNTD